MYLVRLKYKNGGYRLGNGEGQGFYRCKRLNTVIKKLTTIKNTHKRFLTDCVEYEIYSCTELTKYDKNLPLCSVLKIN